MAISEYLEATIIEAETIEVRFVEEDLITVNFTSIDVVSDRGYIKAIVADYFIYNEVPIQLSAKRFQTANSFTTGTLRVFFNGIKEKSVNITIHSSTEFSLPIDTTSEDEVEVSYTKL